jgi:hypothetical protein
MTIDWPGLAALACQAAGPQAAAADTKALVAVTRRKCKAHVAGTGEPCKNWPIAGAEVCVSHGGKARQVKEAAERRVAEQKAVRLAEQLDIDVTKFDGDPRRALAESLIVAQAWAARFGTLLGRLEDSQLRYAGKLSEQTRAEFTMAVSALDRVTAIATALARIEGRAGDNEMVREAAEAAGRAAMIRAHGQLISFVKSAIYSAANGDNERAAKALDELDARVAATTGGGQDGAAAG